MEEHCFGRASVLLRRMNTVRGTDVHMDKSYHSGWANTFRFLFVSTTVIPQRFTVVNDPWIVFFLSFSA